MGSTKIQGEKSRDSGLEAQIKALQKYVPSIVRTAIARDPQRPSLDRHTRDLSILFMDIARRFAEPSDSIAETSGADGGSAKTGIL